MAAPVRLDRAGVEALLPHRPPMVMVDVVDAVVPGESVDARWVVPTGDRRCSPVWLVEPLAQAAALAYLTLPDADGLPLLVGVDDLVLGSPVAPGDAVRLKVTVLDTRRLWRFAAEASVDGEVRAAGTLLASRAR